MLEIIGLVLVFSPVIMFLVGVVKGFASEWRDTLSK